MIWEEWSRNCNHFFVLDALLRFSWSKCTDLIHLVEGFVTSRDSEMDYSSIAADFNVDEEWFRRIVHQLVKITVNVGEAGAKIGDIIDIHPVRSLLEDDERLFICKSVHLLREHPESISSLIDHQIGTHTCGNYVDSSIRFDRNISQRSVYETEGERCASFIWRLQLSDGEEVVLRLPFGALSHLAKQCDLISAEISRIKQAQLRQSHPRS
ncbi:hypothetical protein GCK32_004656 [Trichostrongylus colubriformis]|uniref:COMM domain-containing protein n=1 Tax=Trichostrongylus colubriformis TaxID=6319 RepID=A0AAN8G0J8_TRICO